ncbi:Uncharacterized protein PBTT_05493 [Plasmodiophora brassicae]
MPIGRSRSRSGMAAGLRKTLSLERETRRSCQCRRSRARTIPNVNIKTTAETATAIVEDDDRDDRGGCVATPCEPCRLLVARLTLEAIEASS